MVNYLQFLRLSWADLVLTVAIWADLVAMLGYAATSLATVGGALSSSKGGDPPSLGTPGEGFRERESLLPGKIQRKSILEIILWKK